MILTKPSARGRNGVGRLLSACALVAALVANSSVTLAGELPAGVAEGIEQALPGYNLPSAEQQHVQHIGKGDFDANGMDDFAVLLRGEDDWQLAMALQSADSYQVGVIDQFPGNDSEFRRRFPLDDLRLEVVTPGTEHAIGGATVDNTQSSSASLALRLPEDERTALLFKWDPDHRLFGTTRLHLAALTTPRTCAYDPQSGKPNPLGTRAFVNLEEQDGNTTVIYEQFPQNLLGAAPATLAVRRELVFHQTPIEQARTLMRDEPSYYRELTGDDDPAGFALLDASLACQ